MILLIYKTVFILIYKTLLNKEIKMKCLAIKSFAFNFLQHSIQKHDCNSAHSYNRKP